MKDTRCNIYARCDKECLSERCDDYGADYCADWHTEEEHFQPGHDRKSRLLFANAEQKVTVLSADEGTDKTPTFPRFCAKMAFLSHGCAICQEYWAIHRELQDGETPKRTCHECQYLFDLNSTNPYRDVLYDEGIGEVYFECDECTVLESGIDDIEDEIDRMAELMEMGRR